MDGKHIAAIDLGTSKIMLTIAYVTGNDIQIISCLKAPSDGIRNSCVYNPDKVCRKVMGLIRQAENELQLKVTQVVVGMPRFGVSQRLEIGRLEGIDQENSITREDVEELKRAAQDKYHPENPDIEELYGAVAQSFSNGDEIGLVESDVIGMYSPVLEGAFKLFIGKKKYLQNIDKVFKGTGISVARKYFTPEAVAQAVLTSYEMSNGVALIDFGAGVTSVSIYLGNVMRYYASIPFGGASVTDDIRKECTIQEELAENIKKAFGGCMPDRLLTLSEKVLNISSSPSMPGPDTQISVKYLSEIITARVKEIIEAVLYLIQESGLADSLRNGVVLTGGGASLMNCAAYLKELSGYEVRTGRVRPLFSSSGYDAINATDAATAAGLILMAKDDMVTDCTAETEDAEAALNVPFEVEKSSGHTAEDGDADAGDTGKSESYSDTIFPEEETDTPHGKTGKKSDKKDKNRKDTGEEGKDSSKRTFSWIRDLMEKTGATKVVEKTGRLFTDAYETITDPDNYDDDRDRREGN